MFGWQCPNCGKAHAPSVATCPEPPVRPQVVTVPDIHKLPTLPPGFMPVTMGCPVCGLGKNGEIMGYVCNRSDCPTRVTCSNTAPGGSG